jgi:hypothetical protein
MDGDGSPDGAFQPNESLSPGALGGDFQLDLEFWPASVDQDFTMSSMWGQHVDEANLHSPVPPQSMFAQQSIYGSESGQHVVPGLPRKSEVSQKVVGLLMRMLFSGLRKLLGDRYQQDVC